MKTHTIETSASPDPFRVRIRRLAHANAFMSDVLCLVAQAGLTARNDASDGHHDIAHMTTATSRDGHGVDWGAGCQASPENRPYLGFTMNATDRDHGFIIVTKRPSGHWAFSIPDGRPNGIDAKTFDAFRRLAIGADDAAKRVPMPLRAPPLRTIAACIHLYTTSRKGELDPQALLTETSRLMNPETPLFPTRALAQRGNRRFLSSIALQVPAGIPFSRYDDIHTLHTHRPLEFVLASRIHHREVLRWEVVDHDQNYLRHSVSTHDPFDTTTLPGGGRRATVMAFPHDRDNRYRFMDIEPRNAPAGFAAMTADLRNLEPKKGPMARRDFDRAVGILIAFGAQRFRALQALGRIPRHDELTFIDPS